MTAPLTRKPYTVPTPSDDTRPLTEEEALDALCIQIGDPEIFFAEQGSSYTEAKQVCSNCPIAARCLAVHLDEPDGFFAASPPQRKQIRRELDAAKPKTLGEFWAEGAA